MAVRSQKEIIVPVEGKSHGGTVAKINNCAREIEKVMAVRLQ
ncbi:hypothetical protein [Bacillus sp. OTU2372]